MWLHALSYVPAALMNTLYLLVGDSKANFTALLDDTSVFLIVYQASNMGIITHTLTFGLYLVLVILNYSNIGYWTLFVLYTGIAAYTQWF